eukprot:9170716-Karenia_brevis.AAC.1
MRKAHVKFSCFGGQGAFKIAQQLEKDREAGYERCVVLWFLNEFFGNRRGIKWLLGSEEETTALKEQMSFFQY